MLFLIVTDVVPIYSGTVNVLVAVQIRAMSTKESERNSSAQQTLDSKLPYSNTLSSHSRDTTVLYEISQLLNTHLDKATLATCVGMIENGVNPEALAVCCRLAAPFQELTCMV